MSGRLQACNWFRANPIIPMGPMSRSASDVLRGVLASYAQAPIDFLDRGMDTGEQEYLSRAAPSYERTVRDLELHLGNLEGVRILEIGSYFGAVSLALAGMGAHVTAFDLPRYLLNERLQGRFAAAGIASLPGDLRDGSLGLADGSFDAVIMCETLEHLNFNPIPCLREVHRILRDAGLLYLSLPNVASLSNRKRMVLGRSYHNPIADFFHQLDPTKDFSVGLHWREYTMGEIHELLERLGFTSARSYYHHSPADRLLPRIVYGAWPSMRPNQTHFAVKTPFPGRPPAPHG